MARRRHDWYSDYCVREARQGNPWPLIGRLHSGVVLSAAERDFLAEALEARAGKRGADLIRRAETALIAQQVEELHGGGMKMETAVHTVAKQRRRSPRHVYNAIATAKRSRGII
jgi:hypothetical protein